MDIDALNKLATELLGWAQNLETQIDGPNLQGKALQDSLQKICEALSKTIEIFEKKDSLLNKLINIIDGTLLSHAVDRLTRYIDEHRSFLEKIGVPKEQIEKVIEGLKKQALEKIGGLTSFETPETIENINVVITPLKELRELVCEIANVTDVAMIVANKEVIREIIKGTIGAATIVVDVTGAFHVPDPTAWVYFKAVKSVWSGIRKIKSAVSKLKDMWSAIKTKSHVDKQQEELKKNPPRNPFKK